jgi:hypothetical protein
MASNRYKDILDYTVAYKTVWTIIGVIFALGVAAAIAWHELKPPTEEERARQEVKSAERLLQRAQGCSRGDLLPPDQDLLDKGQASLEAAQQSLAQRANAAALGSARSAQDSLKQFVDRVCSARDVIAEFRRIQGEVKVKKVSSPRWVLARKGPLAVGDRIWATSGVAEVFYPASGETQQLRPGTIIEIKQVLRKEDGSSGTETGFEKGEIIMESMPNSNSVIRAPHQMTVAPSGDLVRVASPEGAAQTDVVSQRGGAHVSTPQGGEATMVRNTVLHGDATGKLSAPEPVLESPQPKEPIDNRIFSVETPATSDITFKWLPVETAQGYRFQIALNDLFVPVLNREEEQRVANTSLIVGPLKPNTYFWRVAAIDARKVDGGWSEVRRFSIRGGGLKSGSPPPQIEILSDVPFGDRVIISGRTGQYVTLEVNLNGKKYKEPAVDEKGEFKVLVLLSQDGKNVIEFVATDTYGQETRKQVEENFSVD